jgi:hypothetical protein
LQDGWYGCSRVGRFCHLLGMGCLVLAPGGRRRVRFDLALGGRSRHQAPEQGSEGAEHGRVQLFPNRPPYRRIEDVACSGNARPLETFGEFRSGMGFLSCHG